MSKNRADLFIEYRCPKCGLPWQNRDRYDAHILEDH